MPFIGPIERNSCLKVNGNIGKQDFGYSKKMFYSDISYQMFQLNGNS